MQSYSPQRLRSELSARSRERGAALPHEVGWSRSGGECGSVVFAAAEDGTAEHGNFLRAAYRRILANPDWARRLEKAYTASAHLPRAQDRRRGELECASSSDALLMNVFCYPGVLRRAEVCALLGVAVGQRPEFGVRAQLRMRRNEVDRTEFDMRLGDAFVEAKLTEGGFGSASRERLLRYADVEQGFDLDQLPTSGRGFAGYQLVRGLMAASACEGVYLVLLDARRHDLQEICVRVLGAARSAELRQRLRLRTWQELAAVVPPAMRLFLAEKYGIEAA